MRLINSVRKSAAVCGFALVALAGVCSTQAQGTAFTYQGRLADNGSLPNASYDMRFTLYDALNNLVGSPLTKASVPVNGGLFTTTLDFGPGIFTGADRFLNIEISPAGAATFTPLSPRQPLTPSPYAIHAGDAGTLGGQSPSSFAPASGSSAYVAKAGDTMTGTLNLPVNGLNVGSSQLLTSGGNVGIGISPGFGLDVNKEMVVYDNDISLRRAGGHRWRLKNLSAGFEVFQVYDGTDTLINQPRLTVADNGYVGIGTATPQAGLEVAGPGIWNSSIGIRDTTSGQDWRMSVKGTDFLVTKVAGATFTPFSILASSADNSLVIGTGGYVGIGTATPATTLDVAGHAQVQGSLFLTDPQQSIQFPATSGANEPMMFMFASGVANADRMVIAHSPSFPDWGLQYQDFPDKFNFLSSGNPVMTVDLGGQKVGVGTSSPVANLDVYSANQAYVRLLSASANNGSVLELRNDTSSPNYIGAINFQTPTTVPGQLGYLSTGGMIFRSGGTERMRIDPSGFVGINRTSPVTGADYFDVSAPVTSGYGGMYVNTTGSSALPFYGYSLAGSAVAWHYVDGSDGNKWKLSYGMTVDTSGNVSATSFNPTSDRNAKLGFANINLQELLERVVSLPISTWAFKKDPSTRHIGPMAQDFEAAFHLGSDDKHIATVDADGVALAAIQGLNQKLEEQIKEKDTRISSLEQRLHKLEQLLNH